MPCTTPDISKFFLPETKTLSFNTANLTEWDSRLLVKLAKVIDFAAAHAIEIDYQGLPSGVHSLLELTQKKTFSPSSDKGDTQSGIFEEIGKELPITVAVVIEAGAIIDLTVLEFRESRGGEVVYPFFTGQFSSAQLEAGKTYNLDKNIDGITGATLSVRALKKIATLALYCDQQAGPAAQ